MKKIKVTDQSTGTHNVPVNNLDEQIRQAVYGEITRLFAYGVDWTEIRDKSKDDHEVSTFAAKIKDDFAKEVTNTLAREISTIISNAVKELVAEAKPPHVHGTTVGSGQFNRGVSEFEQNLLKALEEL